MLVKNSIQTLWALLLALPAGAFAIGLGDNIQLLSPPGAPLHAQVDLVDPTPGELSTLQVRMASPQTYAHYGLDYPAYLAGVQAQVVRTADGKMLIEFTSSEPLHEAALTVVVEMDWAHGRMAREYVVPGPR
jgi:pilus assembly protein FimV